MQNNKEMHAQKHLRRTCTILPRTFAPHLGVFWEASERLLGGNTHRHTQTHTHTDTHRGLVRIGEDWSGLFLQVPAWVWLDFLAHLGVVRCMLSACCFFSALILKLSSSIFFLLLVCYSSCVLLSLFFSCFFLVFFLVFFLFFLVFSDLDRILKA